MSNPLFGMYGNMGNNPMTGIMQRFQQFSQMFRGDPKQQVQQMLNSGKVSQAQYNQAVQMTTQLQRMMGVK